MTPQHAPGCPYDACLVRCPAQGHPHPASDAEPRPCTSDELTKCGVCGLKLTYKPSEYPDSFGRPLFFAYCSRCMRDWKR